MDDSNVALAEAEGEKPVSAPQSLLSLLKEAATANPDGAAIVSLHQPSDILPMLGNSCGPVRPKLSWSYKQLDQGSDLFASCLHSRGICRGQSVAVFLYNCVEWALTFWACAKLGAIFVPLDPRSVSRPSEVTHYLRIIHPAVLVVGDEDMVKILEDNHGGELQGVETKLLAHSKQPFARTSFPSWRTLNDILADRVDEFASIQAIHAIQGELDVDKDVTLIIFTSGTSTLPKACPHTHKNIWAAACAAAVAYTGATAQLLNNTHVLVQHLPNSHIFAVCSLLAFWKVGGSIIFPAKSFSPATTLEAIYSERATHMSAVPSLLTALMSYPAFAKERLDSLQLIVTGGTIISPSIISIAKEKFGARVSVGFGMSEGVPTLHYPPSESMIFQRGYASVGKAAVGARVKICEPQSRRTLHRDEVGELHVGGDMMIEQYVYGDNDVFYKDEQGIKWMITGDQASMDASGAVYILGRYKDLIIRAGENLSPALIEASLNKVTGVVVSINFLGTSEVTYIEVYRPKLSASQTRWQGSCR